MGTLKTTFGITSWGVRLKIQLGLTEFREQEQQQTSKAPLPIAAPTATVVQSPQRAGAAKTFSSPVVGSPRMALGSVRVN